MYGQMNEPPGARARVALSGLTVAEYFRDQEGQDVLLFIDNIFRFTQAGSEVNLDILLCGVPQTCQTSRKWGETHENLFPPALTIVVQISRKYNKNR